MPNPTPTDPAARTPDGKIHLQAVGLTTAILAENIEVGDALVWNYGSVSIVTAVARASKCFMRITTLSSNGSTYERRMKIGRLVGWSARATREHAAA